MYIQWRENRKIQELHYSFLYTICTLKFWCLGIFSTTTLWKREMEVGGAAFFQATVYLARSIHQTVKHLNITKFRAHPLKCSKIHKFRVWNSPSHWLTFYIHRTLRDQGSLELCKRKLVYLNYKVSFHQKEGFHFKVSAPF